MALTMIHLLTSVATGKSRLPSRHLLDFPQFLKLRPDHVILVERVATADEAVARSSRAITERAANHFWVQRAFLQRVRENRWISQRHSAQTDHVRPTVADDMLGDVREILLQIRISRTDDDGHGAAAVCDRRRR